MKCDRRIEKEMYGKLCDVKYIQSYCEEDFRTKFDELSECGYEILWKTKEGLILQYKWKDTDMVILNCKAPIRKEWYYPSFIVS